MLKGSSNVNTKYVLGILVMIVLFFAGFIVINEYKIHSGEKVFLKVWKLDPRDLLRGNYLTLSYEIANDFRVKDFVLEHDLEAGDGFYIILEKDGEDVGHVKSVSLNSPKEGLFLKAKVDYVYDSHVRVILPDIDKYFIPENLTKDQREMIRELDYVLVSIDKHGNAIIVGLYDSNKNKLSL